MISYKKRIVNCFFVQNTTKTYRVHYAVWLKVPLRVLFGEETTLSGKSVKKIIRNG